MGTLSIFGLGAGRELAFEVAVRLGTMPAAVTEAFRHDGEPWAASADNVRGRDVFVVSSLHGDDERSVNDRVMQLLLFVNALKHASAGRVTAVCPYLAYMRQDRKEGSREPISTQALAVMMEGVGVDRVLTIDVHNPAAIQNAFRIPVDILEARKPLADLAVADLGGFGPPTTVVSPDAGGVKRARAFRDAIAKRLGRRVGFAHADKTRTESGVSVAEIVGDVRGTLCVLVDDMISTGRTIGEVGRAVADAGGYFHGVVATHGLFVGDAGSHLLSCPHVYVADTAGPPRLGGPLRGRVRVAGVAPMFAEAIRRIHSGEGSISELLTD